MILNDPTPVHSLDTEVLTRLGVAAVLGLLLGLDRELRGHPAGLRTHGIVCFTAALMTVSIIALHRQFSGGGGGQGLDLLRVFEGAGAFVGIVAAGLIVVSRGEVHNLTTAVHIWLATIIGIACGAGQWPLVTVATLIAIVMLTLLRVFSRDPKEEPHKADTDAKPARDQN